MNRPIKEKDLGWAAGFVDGEGCVLIAVQRYPGRKNPTFRPMLTISQNHKPTLEHFRNVIGVHSPIYAMKRHPNQRRQPWVLPYVGHKAIKVMTLLEPHLIRKGPEVAVCKQLWLNTHFHRRYGCKGIPEDVINLRWKLHFALRDLK